MNTRAIVHDLAERERWVRELFANPNVSRLHKLVLVALIWCAADQGLHTMRKVGVNLNELACMLGEDVEDVRGALYDLRDAGILHEVDV
jgi:hypothetical protein